MTSMIGPDDSVLLKALDSNPAICIITDGISLVYGNRAFYRFLETIDSAEFDAQTFCLANIFENEEGFIHPEETGTNWLDSIVDIPGHYTVLIRTLRTLTVFSIAANRFHDRDRSLYIITMQAIDEQMQQQGKLLREYREAVDRSAIVSKTDKQGIITYVNEKFCQVSGYESQELIGKPHRIIRHPDMPSETFQQMWQTVLSKKPWYGVVKNLKKDGGSYYVDTVINPIIDCNGNIVEFIGIRYDITDLEIMKRNLYNEIEETQKELIFRLGEISETRSPETGNHVKRVAEYSKLLALAYGLDEQEATLLHLASPMHDIGKIGIPDHILNKEGPLDSIEREVMRSHCERGHTLLKSSERPILKTAAVVALQHHEKWDGSGYPRGLKGEAIHIFGRITAIADVFDALSSKRFYKDAWPDEKIFAFFKTERGRHFDPNLIDIFFNNIQQFIHIRDSLKDDKTPHQKIA